MKNDPMGDRMKRYEAATRAVLPRRTYTIIRVDGKAFHSYLRHADKPFDYEFMGHMGGVATILCQEIQGAVFAYHQSDEISVLLTDFANLNSEPWFGGVVQKMASVSASIATAELLRWRIDRLGRPLFDSRVFTIPDPVEVANYFVWRQRDAVRNSITMAAQEHFSHKELHQVNTSQMQEKLWKEKGINWNNYPAGARRGGVAVKVQSNNETTIVRSWWDFVSAPHFKAEPGSWLASMIPSLPTLEEK